MSNSEKNQLCEECGRDRVEFPDETVCAWCLARGEDLTRYREEGMVWTVQPRTLGEFDPVQAERQGMERLRRTSR